MLDNFNHLDIYYQSGVGYFASRPSASFEYKASNFYRNVYQNGVSITFPTTTNCSISNIKANGSGVTTFDSNVFECNMPSLDGSANCHNRNLHITGNVLFDDLTSISGAYGSNSFTHYDITAQTVKYYTLFKSDRTTSQASKTNFMVYSGSITDTLANTDEHFETEDYRIVSGNYINQAAITSVSGGGDSTTSVNDTVSNADHADGLVTVNGYLISPFKIGNAGDTRNVTDGGSLQAPPSNPNYSTLSR